MGLGHSGKRKRTKKKRRLHVPVLLPIPIFDSNHLPSPSFRQGKCDPEFPIANKTHDFSCNKNSWSNGFFDVELSKKTTTAWPPLVVGNPSFLKEIPKQGEEETWKDAGRMLQIPVKESCQPLWLWTWCFEGLVTCFSNPFQCLLSTTCCYPPQNKRLSNCEATKRLFSDCLVLRDALICFGEGPYNACETPSSPSSASSHLQLVRAQLVQLASGALKMLLLGAKKMGWKPCE